MLTPWGRALVAVAIVAGAAALVFAGFRTGIATGGPFGWFWVALIVAIAASNLHRYAVRGRAPWSDIPSARRRTPD